MGTWEHIWIQWSNHFRLRPCSVGRPVSNQNTRFGPVLKIHESVPGGGLPAYAPSCTHILTPPKRFSVSLVYSDSLSSPFYRNWMHYLVVRKYKTSLCTAFVAPWGSSHAWRCQRLLVHDATAPEGVSCTRRSPMRFKAPLNILKNIEQAGCPSFERNSWQNRGWL